MFLFQGHCNLKVLHAAPLSPASEVVKCLERITQNLWLEASLCFKHTMHSKAISTAKAICSEPIRWHPVSFVHPVSGYAFLLRVQSEIHHSQLCHCMTNPSMGLFVYPLFCPPQYMTYMITRQKKALYILPLLSQGEEDERGVYGKALLGETYITSSLFDTAAACHNSRDKTSQWPRRTMTETG